MLDWIRNYLDLQKRSLDSIDHGAVVELAGVLRDAHAAGRMIFACGNGASAANSSHFACDLGKNGSAAMPAPFRVLSLNDNTPWMTAIGNDFAYEDVYWRQLSNYAQAGDVLVGISVSGNSPNVVKALEWAREHKMRTVAIIGGHRGKAGDIAELSIVVDDRHFGRAEDAHMTILHMAVFAFMEGVVPPRS